VANGEKSFDLKCYIHPAWQPRIRAASPRRDWMDDTPESFAYRCLPLNIANAHGWEVLSPCGFEAEWNGGPAVNDVVVRPDAGTPPKRAPVALFGHGTVTLHVEGIFRTPPGYNLWIGGPPNSAKDGIAPLNGIVETDWSPFTFTMNWRFTRARHRVRFEENEPFCFLFPIERGLIESVRPRIVSIEEDQELKRRFEEWSARRDKFQAEVAASPPAKPSEKWQKFYYRGVDACGAPGAPDHQSKLRVSEFEGAERFNRETPPHPPPPRTAAVPESNEDRPSSGKFEWILSSLETLRRQSPRKIPARSAITPEQFLEEHYAANWPVRLSGELAGWPALGRWTPEYLKTKIGSAAVEVQAGRSANPDFERNMAAHRTTMPFDEFIDRVTTAGGNDLYLTAYNSASNEAALAPLQEDLGFLDKLLDRADGRSRGMMWIGGEGTFTPLHHDLTNNLLLQIVGRKRLLLVAPGATPRLYNDHHVYSQIRDLLEPGILSRYPKLEGIHVHQIMLNPGEALFIPLGWWHQVSSLDFSVTITHTNFRWPNDFHATHPR
jgi:Family of unknown function (DUF6065)/Cupin-like domain